MARVPVSEGEAMLNVYLYYPIPRICVHESANCADIGKMQKLGQRHVRLDPESVSEELAKFHGKQYKFASDASSNDMWLEIDFADAEFERALLDHVRRLLGKQYTGFSGVKIETHC
jgi:hypothetical protein